MTQDDLEMTQDELADTASEETDEIMVKQDGYRNVLFGQIADGLVPPHPGDPESTEDELCRAAMSDPSATEEEPYNYQPTPWRVIFLVAVVVAALAIVFWKK
ncbi:MAG: hypothetical protein FWG02_02370 [Holophagaceae bacterium]|nr:hypothetical protein [Holophagaceae bacterium]